MRLLIAGGGTGGHLFPGIAVAEEFLARDPENLVLFVGTERGIEKKTLSKLGYNLKIIRTRGLVEMGLIDRIKALMVVPIGLLQSINIIRKFKPDFALGVGGYVSGPAMIAAWLLRVPGAIHEQNTVPGMTNKILGRFTDRIFITFDEVREYFPYADKKKKIILTGNPIRKKILEKLTSPEKDDRENGRFCILIVGGSHGAQRLNQLMLDALPHLKKHRDNLKIIHQTGQKGQYDVALGYAKQGIRAMVKNFIDNLEDYLCECDILVSRAGAGAIAEIALSGRPSILVPFPYAADDHQTKNAQCLVREGAALLFSEDELSGKKLAEAIEKMIEDPETLKEMSDRVYKMAMPRASADLVDEIYAIVKPEAGAGKDKD